VEVSAERLHRLSMAAKESGAAAAADREARDAAISEADDAGWGLRQIARACEMSLSHTQRIVVRETADRQAAADEAPGID
jgi:hypothetical protein